jgi:Family of unknown function (DUF6188)
VELISDGDGFNVSAGGSTVTLVLLDYRLSFRALDDDNVGLGVVIAMPFDAVERANGERVRIDPAKKSAALGQLAVGLRFRRLDSCSVAPGGILHLQFDNRELALTVPPHPSYEAWQLDGPSFKVIAVPGGELAIWRDD